VDKVMMWLLFLVVVAILLLCAWGFVQTRSGGKKCKSIRKGCCEHGATVGCWFPVCVTPAGLDIDAEGRYAYVANNNNYGITGSDSVTVLDVKCCSVVTTILDTSFNEPYTVTIAPDGKRVYVTNSAGSTISIIDPETNTVIGTIDGFDGPSGLVILAKQPNIGYVNNYGSAGGVGSGNGTTVSVVDLETGTIIGTIVVGLAPAALAADPSGEFIYVINYVDGLPDHGTVSVIETSTNTVVATITGFFGPFGIAITHDGKKAYVTNFGSNNFAPYGTSVSVVDLVQRAIVKDIPVGIQPAGIAIKGRFAYVTNYNTLYAGPMFTDLTAGQGTVSVIDIRRDRTVPPTLLVGQSPANIAIRGSTALVSAYTSNTVTKLHL